MFSEIIAQPALEPLTTAEAKEHLRVDLSEENALIDAAIVAARSYVENFMRRALITQTRRITMTGWGGPSVRLSFGPVQSISSVQYLDPNGDGSTFITVPSDDYKLVRSSWPHCIAPRYGKTWPTPAVEFDNVQIDVVAGYGDNASDVPGDIISAVKLMTAHFYENRQNEVAGTIVSKLSVGAERLLMPHVIHV